MKRTCGGRAFAVRSYGWIVDKDSRGRNRLTISGSTVGVMASLRVLPDEGIVSTALVNCWCRNARDAELIFGGPERIVNSYLDSLVTRSQD